jgi:uncharacterized OB-fold protein
MAIVQAFQNFRLTSEPGQSPCLLGSRCRNCGTVVFPKMPVCPACRKNGTMEEAEIGRTGKLYSHSIAQVAPQGFPAPSFQIFVELAEGPRVFALVGCECPVELGVLEDGMELRLVIEPVSPTRKDTLTYKYVPLPRMSGDASDA